MGTRQVGNSPEENYLLGKKSKGSLQCKNCRLLPSGGHGHSSVNTTSSCWPREKQEATAQSSAVGLHCLCLIPGPRQVRSSLHSRGGGWTRELGQL